MDRFWLLISLKLDNEASAAELQELDQLLQEHPEGQDILAQARHASAFKAHPLQTPDAGRSFSKHVQRLSNHLSRTPEPFVRQHRYKKLYLLSGSIAASLLAVFLLFNYMDKHNSMAPANVISTRFGSKSKVQLPDGTLVWLNADSRLTYGKDFGNRLREVSLSGEAFFDVQKDADHPFVIHTGSLDVKVLGTAFNIRSYQNEKTSEATLIRGAIEVTLNSSPERKIVMKPSDRIVVENKAAPDPQTRTADTLYWVGKVDVKENGNAGLETVWKKNSLAFKNETLEDVAGRIEHWFNVKVSIEDEELKKITYSCDFKDESLKQVMEALHMTGKFQYQILKDSVVITK
jgi:ferric-dicitrate binding protein FerR (iron transport regulator)